MGVQLVQNLASKAQEGSGDGTTTACILAQAFCNELFKTEEHMTTHEFNILMEFLLTMEKFNQKFMYFFIIKSHLIELFQTS